jgi:uncharacterized membrane protein
MPDSPQLIVDQPPSTELIDSRVNGTVSTLLPIEQDLGRGFEQETLDDFDKPARFSLLSIGLFCTLVVGFLLRLSAAQNLSSHVDESASIMAAQMVAEKGIPLFPSGVLYLQGATISYLLALPVKLGYGNIEHLTDLRMLSVVFSTLAILVLYFLAKYLVRSAWTGLAVAALLAVDPASVRWGAMVRMYALLQLVSLIVVFLFLQLLKSPGTRGRVIAFISAFWIGVFTHIAICLLLPPILILTAWRHRFDLFGRRSDLLLAVGGACGAPFLLLLLNQFGSPTRAVSVSSNAPKISFVGNYLLSVKQILHPRADSWLLLFRYGQSGRVIAALLVVVSLVLIGHYFWDTRLPIGKTWRKDVILSLLLLYWLPIILVGCLANEHNERYLLHVHPLGLVLLGFGAQELFWKDRPYAARNVALPSKAVTYPPVGALETWERLVTPRLQWLTRARIYSVLGIAILLTGTLLRFIGYNSLSLWLDEAFSLLYSKQQWTAAAGFHGFYSPHPPLYFLTTKVFNQVLPDVLAGRALSVLCGVLVLPVFWSLARRLLDPPAAAIATVVFALSPIHIYYSQEARMYSMVVLFVCLSFLALITFDQTGRRRWAVVYGVSLTIAAYTDYSSLFVLGPQALLLLLIFWRRGRRMLPLVTAGGLAVLAYLPWLPQVWHSVNLANEDERRSDYLGTGITRVFSIVLRMSGVSADSRGPYFPSLRKAPWESLPEIHTPILIAILVLIALGVAGLWNRWRGLAVTFCFLGCVPVAIIISLASPGFAERTILSAVVGWSLLVGAAFNGRLHREKTAAAAISLIAVLTLCLGTIENMHSSGVKQRFNDASADLATVSPLQFPVLTYSYGAVADTVIDAYEPGLIDSMRVITVRDGELERTLSNDVLPKKGITVADVEAGRLQELLPNTPDNDLIWYFWYFRRGEEVVRQGLAEAGYSQVMHRIYDAPRGRVYLDLYAREGANLGSPLPGIVNFSVNSSWGIPVGSPFVSQSADGRSVTIRNSSSQGTAVTTQLEAPGGGLYTVDQLRCD